MFNNHDLIKVKIYDKERVGIFAAEIVEVIEYGDKVVYTVRRIYTDFEYCVIEKQCSKLSDEEKMLFDLEK